ncbi:MAG TPA: hypothetical protein PLM53_10980 [Spirochaetota bacterium]|nr:hypothetical protein [Spirochaetota bacterium]HQH97614.1 hypothetical protein [Spirochaetota bacterium]HQJ71406.1 hypothetical protein [Spirochaetota bacterium]HRS77954.1 hypothetical protein [Spirochaetota bacterium]HRT76004.1 hypothetical protein [Spirochaetota bacterium]
MTAREAWFTRDSSSILIHWANAREDLKRLDRHFQVADIAGSRELWVWQYVNDRTDACLKGARNAKICEAIIHAPSVFDDAHNRIV